MNRIIDFHTHAFPDRIAESTVAKIGGLTHVTPCLDGKIDSLLASMDKAGIGKSVLCSIATRAEQFDNILVWSKDAATDRIIMFPSIHPDDQLALERISIVADAGFKGLKMHPYYQGFTVNDPKMFSFYERMQECGLILMLHAGFDIGYPRDRIADPVRIASIADMFPELEIIAAHMGGWSDGDNVEEYLVGKKVYFDTSFGIKHGGKDQAKRIINNHLPEYLLFGTDSPWTDQAVEVRLIKELDISDELKEMILWKNAEKLLG
jgi:predicted TIM-barrel fold metal-dependent hydrolase